MEALFCKKNEGKYNEQLKNRFTAAFSRKHSPTGQFYLDFFFQKELIHYLYVLFSKPNIIVG